MNSVEIAIIGGGLAGLTAALDLVDRGKEVLIIEKNKYPKHKVCGEYVSNEVKPYLGHLGIDLDRFNLPQITTLQLSTQKGKSVSVDLPSGGFGISRYTFDNLLYEKAFEKGVQFLFDTVSDVTFDGDVFQLTTSEDRKIECKVAIGAFGKRSNLDKKLNRSFINNKSPWLGIKGHYTAYPHPEHLVGLHNFPGGYGGLSKTEDGCINFCYLVQYESFKKEGTVEEFHKNVISENPLLKEFLMTAKLKFEKPLSIAQISFDRKKAVENHMLMCGDTAGLIHPLCGNGMAMAIHSAKIAAEQIDLFLENKEYHRNIMELNYQRAWKKNFSKRMWMGRRLQALMIHTEWFDMAISTLANSKRLLRGVIASTHGKPITV
ncbi:NAD(P)/FAD-dependent oxidoreductase [Flagellimonas allohymeniacidonis]|uniref:NAD(P)/FAD-dependent oxidoreductase n=1 Tax=Flagellimonas allohymeniacidonis TaxID=2517819 RepID=A0A4V2HT08_9FLAO|nr:NAD(P)/FAD-dependent oxidoreductase [Allomuricauda hymeniacidonis]